MERDPIKKITVKVLGQELTNTFEDHKDGQGGWSTASEAKNGGRRSRLCRAS
jgi:hypothetical protein